MGSLPAPRRPSSWWVLAGAGQPEQSLSRVHSPVSLVPGPQETGDQSDPGVEQSVGTPRIHRQPLIWLVVLKNLPCPGSPCWVVAGWGLEHQHLGQGELSVSWLTRLIHRGVRGGPVLKVGHRAYPQHRVQMLGCGAPPAPVPWSCCPWGRVWLTPGNGQ